MIDVSTFLLERIKFEREFFIKVEMGTVDTGYIVYLQEYILR